MIVRISNQACIGIERGVYYFDLADYPRISALELKNLRDFIAYEQMYGRQTEIVCEDAAVLAAVNDAIKQPETGRDPLLQDFLPEYVYHGTDILATKHILSGGRLLSAVKAYGKSGETLAYEKRDSPWNDPADYFEYIMFGWGDSPVGDYVVLSETPEGEQGADDPERFMPGVRFYFRYADLLKHPGHVFDGYHVIKVKDEIILSDYLHACIVPDRYKKDLEDAVLPALADKIHYLPQNGLGIFEWTKSVYDFVRKL